MTFKNIILLLVVLLIGCTYKTDETEESRASESPRNENFKYLNQNPPSMTPEIFAPDLISSKTNQEFGSVFSKDGTEFFYGVNINHKAEIRYTKLVDNKWSNPQPILSHELYGYNDPFLSLDEKRLYFISQRSIDGTYKKGDSDIWYVEKRKDGWSNPINAGPKINSKGNEFYISFTNEGTMYFSSNQDIYYSKSINGTFQDAILLGDSINTTGYESDVFVDPNESYIIFCSKGPEGIGSIDLYISFSKNDGSWTKAKNMGQSINSEGAEFCPFVSKDKKYLFYASKGDIYWVDAKVIEQYRSEKADNKR